MALTNRMMLLFSSIVFHLVAINSRIAFADDDHFSWLNSNFPIHFPVEDRNTNNAIIVSAGNLSEQCLQDTRLQLDALRADLSWAVEMYESSGSLTDKVIETASGNVHHDMGLYDECLTAVDPHRDNVTFQTKYCTVFFARQTIYALNNYTTTEGEPFEYMSNFVNPSVAFCIPSSCSARELRSAVSHRIRHLPLVSLSSENFCYSRDKIQSNQSFDTGAIITSCIIGLLILLIIVATIKDMFGKSLAGYDQHLIIKLLHCFSARRNTRALMSTKVKNDKDNLSCLNGIRFVCMSLLIACHTALRFVGYPYNSKTFYKAAIRLDLQAITNASVFVEPFFLMSGLLASLSLLRLLDRNKGSFNILCYYFHRYIRLTPLYAIVVAFVANVLPHIGAAPAWHIVRQTSEIARQMWWANLLYICNTFEPKFESYSHQMSMGETWYLACDMQMFWLSPLFIYPLWRWKKAGLIWVVSIFFTLLVASTIPFIVIDDLPPSLTVFKVTMTLFRTMKNHYDYYYKQTYCRLPPYIIGILLGWLLYNKEKNNRCNIKLNKIVLAFGWITSSVSGLVVLYGLAPFFNQDSFYFGYPEIGSFVRITYGAFHRTAFSLAIAWVIFACTNQYGGFVNRFLSIKIFLPLSRLCYAAYLINPNLLRVYAANQRQPSYFNESDTIVTVQGVLSSVFLLSFAVSLVAEMPFLNLSKLLFANLSKNVVATSKHQRKNHDGEENKSLQDPSSSHQPSAIGATPV